MAKVLLLCQDVVGESMAGPAIRYWELAKALSKKHQVTLASPNVTTLQSDQFTTVSWKNKSQTFLVPSQDVIITQLINPSLVWTARKFGVRIICDAYDPMPLENLEIFRDLPIAERWKKHDFILGTFNFCFKMADGFICANSRQKDLWTGFSLSKNKINPPLYDQDSSLNSYIGIVPFGLSSAPPKRTGPGLRELFSIPADHKVLLWGGGIWNWFDPLTLIQAIKEIQKYRKDVHLVFMGIKHPNDQVPAMAMAAKAIQLAKDLDLLNKNVHVNYGWVPYHERQNFFLEADFGVSTHFDNLETRFAFRTRMLDYIWAGLPMIATQGDFFSEFIESHQLGVTIPACDVQALSKAIMALCEQPDKVAQIRKQIAQIRPSFFWESIVKPLDEMIERFMTQPKPSYNFSTFCEVTAEVLRIYSPQRICKFLLKKMTKR